MGSHTDCCLPRRDGIFPLFPMLLSCCSIKCTILNSCDVNASKPPNVESKYFSILEIKLLRKRKKGTVFADLARSTRQCLKVCVLFFMKFLTFIRKQAVKNLSYSQIGLKSEKLEFKSGRKPENNHLHLLFG